jgi:murein DD-endopeptidase MepM/ murein hydrolase activator NlpD
VPLGAASLPALAAQTDAETMRHRWMSNRAAVSETTSGLEALDAATAAALAEYEQVQQRLAQSRRRLASLRRELREAAARQQAAETANEVAIQRLGQATMVMVRIEDSLAEHAADLDVTIVAAYKYAGSSARFGGMVDALISSGSLTDFTTAYDKLQAGTADQARLVEVITVLAERLVGQRQLVAALQRRTEAAEQRAVAERSRVARLTRQQATVVAEIAEDRQVAARMVKHLKRQAAAASRRLDELQAESARLRDELGTFRFVGGLPGSTELAWPTSGPATSGFGSRLHPIFDEVRMHAGIDIPAPTGQAVYAVRDGVVRTAGDRGGYGTTVVIDHGDGMSTVYAHLSAFAVAVGTWVQAGAHVGSVGSTGTSTGPHLHFEVRLGGVPNNPMNWL